MPACVIHSEVLRRDQRQLGPQDSDGFRLSDYLDFLWRRFRGDELILDNLQWLRTARNPWWNQKIDPDGGGRDAKHGSVLPRQKGDAVDESVTAPNDDQAARLFQSSGASHPFCSNLWPTTVGAGSSGGRGIGSWTGNSSAGSIWPLESSRATSSDESRRQSGSMRSRIWSEIGFASSSSSIINRSRARYTSRVLIPAVSSARWVVSTQEPVRKSRVGRSDPVRRMRGAWALLGPAAR